MNVCPLDGGGVGAVTASGRPREHEQEGEHGAREFQRKLVEIVRGQLARLRDDLDQHVPSGG